MKPQLWTRYENHLLNEGISRARINKLSTMHNAIVRGLQKPLEKVTREDMEQFVTKLTRNQFRREDGKPYTGLTKVDIKKILKQFYKWLLGDNEYYPKQVSWIKTRISKDELPEEKACLTYKEALQFANGFTKPEYRILTLLLFDSGFRIMEMLNVRKRDLTFEPFEDDNECFWIKCQKSKTEPRKVPVPLFTEDISQFANTAYFRSLDDDDKIWKVGYRTVNKNFHRVGQRILKKKITPHALRHSSATYYSRAYDGNMTLIAQRYGWSFSSKELTTYIRRSGAYERAGAKKIYTNEVEALKREQRELNKKLREHEQRFRKILAKIKEAE